MFFDLPYWFRLDAKHCLDVMHIEKNVCDSLIGTLLNIPYKTKDDKNSRLDMMEMSIRQELTLENIGKRSYLTQVCHTLPKKEINVFASVCMVSKFPKVILQTSRNLYQ